MRVRWRGEALDRLLDEGHATLVDLVVAVVAAAGWQVALEVTFNAYGDRGSIDVLAWHPATRCLLERGAAGSGLAGEALAGHALGAVRRAPVLVNRSRG